MIKRQKQFGVSLTETAIVVGVVALLTMLSMPAIKTLFNSMATEDGTSAMVNAALSSAKSMALQQQKYVGVRFQKAYDERGVLNAPQYMIFIIHDDTILPGWPGNLSCKVVGGINPIKLPENIEVMDFRFGSALNDNEFAQDPEVNPDNYYDATCFTILFSPSGKLIVHDLWVKNRDGASDDSSEDNVFNTYRNVADNKIGLLIQDELREYSRKNFYLYNKQIFKEKYNIGKAYSEYLYKLKPVHINAYTGRIISNK
ncbi:MAG: hypothetical protein PHF37_09570 [Phycisphaerae bacterium]|nr:hypothetical protein [Phycisphaerae bacterium]